VQSELSSILAKFRSRNDHEKDVFNGQWSFVIRPLQTFAGAVLIAFGAGEEPERRANLPSPQMTIDK